MEEEQSDKSQICLRADLINCPVQCLVLVLENAATLCSATAALVCYSVLSTKPVPVPQCPSQIPRTKLVLLHRKELLLWTELQENNRLNSYKIIYATCADFQEF